MTPTPGWQGVGSILQLVQPSFAVSLPSSHSSTPSWTKPSPQRAARHTQSVFSEAQTLVQASVLKRLPSSQSSPADTTLSPQTTFLQLCVQVSPSAVLPSSHSSSP